MPRRKRHAPGDTVYHVINRGNGRAEVFHKDDDYAAFIKILSLAAERHNMRILAYCLMPNHFHLVLWPRGDSDLSAFMQWLTTCHVRRYHKYYKSSGHVWQGRYKSFPIQDNKHLLTVLKYVERNPVRAKLVQKSQDWKYSSARFWVGETGTGSLLRRGSGGLVPVPFSPVVLAGALADNFAGKGEQAGSEPESGSGTSLRSEPDPDSSIVSWLFEGPTSRPRPWLRFVNRVQAQEALRKLRLAVQRGSPFGDDEWIQNAAMKMGLESTLKPRGRPKR
ncbi:MAG: transposase [Planctomycetota bacterium]